MLFYYYYFKSLFLSILLFRCTTLVAAISAQNCIFWPSVMTGGCMGAGGSTCSYLWAQN